MKLDPKFYMHDSDKIALQALQAIPGFSQVFKAFMKVWSEKQFRIQNMSTNLRISEKQLPQYYQMLPPICEKLGIEVPELYLKLDVEPNAYTAGDTNPFIVITSGLLQTMPEHLIPTVIAHECGHIACHHSLYSTMGRFILSEAASLLGLDGIALFPIQVAFSYWMRCSELSADRAAALYDGASDNIVEMCLRFSGFDKNIPGQINVEEFMNQALDYQQMVNESKWDKTLEFLLLSQVDHPLNAVRAKECRDWCATDRFTKIHNYLLCTGIPEDMTLGAYLREIPTTEGSKALIGKPVAEVVQQLRDMGFENITSQKVTQKSLMTKPQQVVRITLNGQDGFEKFGWYPFDAAILVEYYEPATAEEIAAAHPGQVQAPGGLLNYIYRPYTEALSAFRSAGFQNITLDPQYKGKPGLFGKEGAVTSITVNGQGYFEKGDWFNTAVPVCISYTTYVSGPIRYEDIN